MHCPSSPISAFPFHTDQRLNVALTTLRPLPIPLSTQPLWVFSDPFSCYTLSHSSSFHAVFVCLSHSSVLFSSALPSVGLASVQPSRLPCPRQLTTPNDRQQASNTHSHTRFLSEHTTQVRNLNTTSHALRLLSPVAIAAPTSASARTSSSTSAPLASRTPRRTSPSAPRSPSPSAPSTTSRSTTSTGA